MSAADFIVDKADFSKARFVDRSAAPLSAGQVRLRIDAFAMTANNVTYAAFADFAGYWNHFPTGDDATGRVPFWGFATVAESTVPGLAVGTRVYGYLPASTDLVIEPTGFDPYGFSDGSAHRKDLPAFYSRFHLTETDPAYDPQYEDIQMLVRPLYATGWLIDDALMTRETPPSQVLVSSASSKTALAYAHKAKSRDGLMLTGLTSPRNVGFVEKTGLYDQVISYDALDGLPRTGPAILTDFLGDPSLRSKIANVLGDAFVLTLTIGATAWDAIRNPDAVTSGGGPGTEMFFAPGHADLCAKRMGPAAFATALNSDMRAFYPVAAKLITPERASGAQTILDFWADMVAGKVAPDRGIILSV